jgi:MFS family permease
MTTASLESPTRWAVISLTIGAAILAAFQIGKVPVALGDIRADLAFGLVAAGWVISIFNFIKVFGGMPAGAIVSRFGTERMGSAGIALLGLAGLVGAWAPDTTVLLVSRFLEGLGFLMFQVSVPSLILRYAAPRHQKVVFGVFGAYMGIGQAIIMVISPPLLDEVGWRGLWVANAIALIAVAAAFAAATRLPAVVRAVSATRSFWIDMRETVTARGPLALGLCFGAYALNYLTIVGFLPTILVELGLTARHAAYLAALAALTNGAGNVMGGVLLQRGVTRWKLLVASHGTNLAMSFAIFSPELPLELRLACCLVSMGVSSILPPSMFSAVALHAPRPALVPMANGLMTQGTALGQVVGPPLVAAVATASGGWQWSPLVLVTFAVGGLALALYIRALEAHSAGERT